MKMEDMLKPDLKVLVLAAVLISISVFILPNYTGAINCVTAIREQTIFGEAPAPDYGCWPGLILTWPGFLVTSPSLLGRAVGLHPVYIFAVIITAVWDYVLAFWVRRRFR